MKYLVLALVFLSLPAVAADAEVLVTIKNNSFIPSELHIPAGKKVKLVIDNQDATAEEFESYELNREKVIPANSRGFVFVGPLAAGRYPFFGDFHQKTARGAVIVE